MSPTIGILLLVSIYVGAISLTLALSDGPLPEWLFPVRGRWLRYFLGGIGLLLALPILLPVALTFSPLWVVIGLCDLASRIHERWRRRRNAGAAFSKKRGSE